MMFHPLVLSVAACDLAAVVLLVLALVPSARTVVGWQPGAATPEQLKLERQSEAAALRVRWALGVFVLGTVVLVVALAGVLPDVVPGAMCGTGVVQATAGLMTRALALRLLAVVLLAAWQMHDRLDRSVPTSPLAVQAARLVLVAAPVTALAALDTGRGLLSLDTAAPVDCCAMVFDQVESLTGGGGAALSDALLVRGTLLPGVLLVLLAVWAAVRPRDPQAVRSAVTGVVTVAWVALAALALVRVLSAYHYGVLHHHCPWCLFLPEHRLVGYALFAALLVALLEGGGMVLAARAAAVSEELQPATDRRLRLGAVRLLVALTVFAVMAGWPALAWRLRHGVWMSG